MYPSPCTHRRAPAAQDSHAKKADEGVFYEPALTKAAKLRKAFERRGKQIEEKEQELQQMPYAKFLRAIRAHLEAQSEPAAALNPVSQLRRTLQDKFGTDPQLAKEFLKLDVNRDGALTVPELRAALASYAIETTDDNLRALIDRVDENGDGEVQFEDFVNIVFVSNDGQNRVAHKQTGQRGGAQDFDTTQLWRASQGPDVKPVKQKYAPRHCQAQLISADTVKALSADGCPCHAIGRTASTHARMFCIVVCRKRISTADLEERDLRRRVRQGAAAQGVALGQ